VCSSDLNTLHGAPRNIPAFVGSTGAVSFAIDRGTVWIDAKACDSETTDLVVAHSSGLFKNENGVPAVAVSNEDIAGKDSELIACEIECHRAGKPVVFVDIPIAGIDFEEPAEISGVRTGEGS